MKTNFTLQSVKKVTLLAIFAFSFVSVKADGDTKVHEEKFPTYFNTGFATTLNSTFAALTGAWAAWSNNSKATVVVVDYAQYSAPCAIKMVNYSTCGVTGTSTSRATSPLINMLPYALSNSVKMEFYVFSYETNNSSSNDIAIEFFNGLTWNKVWGYTGAQFNSQIGLNNWKKVNLQIPAAYRVATFRYRIVGNMAGNVCANQYIYFDDFTIKASSPSLLPTEVDFTAREQAGAHLLQWTNANEGGNLQYVVERSNDGRNFSSISTVTPANATGSQTYQYTDNSPLNGVNYYRLAVKTRNGATEYSAIRVIANKNKNAQVSMFPNPATTFTNVSIPAAWQHQQVLIQVFDASGRAVINEKKQSAAATEFISLQQLPAGNFRMLVSNYSTGEKQSLSFIHQ